MQYPQHTVSLDTFMLDNSDWENIIAIVCSLGFSISHKQIDSSLLTDTSMLWSTSSINNNINTNSHYCIGGSRNFTDLGLLIVLICMI